MHVQMYEADLTRAAAILQLLAPTLEERANEAVKAVAEAISAIAGAVVADSRLRHRTDDLIDLHLELEDIDRRSTEEAA